MSYLAAEPAYISLNGSFVFASLPLLQQRGLDLSTLAPEAWLVLARTEVVCVILPELELALG